ncbi:hypothetical protein COX53_03175 [candidate division WWE3 bacterium CG23_combo_of_CG06-09_8_20_14_all_40_14]|uniref:DNA-directed DNA polymerase n=1 Tax=candidate division WWE3 bacterium CG23_combo_of_CG06-09_8_20_14_all_40_14 TaxID=1975095 RepID=A0A2G9XBK1_UNCKA|nr:MAG: hypothetical protein COX53_03175 [candidate division WWE3 bacterium CG23_combo_of_CG06-09_8_20_14_all_40_14]
MIYLIYGSDLVQSRNFLGYLKAKLENTHIKTIRADKGFNFGLLKTEIPSSSLFSERVSTLIEFEKAPNVEKTGNLLFLEKLPATTTVVMWIGENLEKTNALLKYGRGKKDFVTKAFNKKNSVLNFELVDMINTKNPRSLIILDKILTKDSDTAFILTILANNFKNMLAVKLGNNLAKNLHPFVRTKLEKAQKNFSEEGLVDILRRIYEADVKTKSNICDIKSEMFSLFCYILNFSD